MFCKKLLFCKKCLVPLLQALLSAVVMEIFLFYFLNLPINLETATEHMAEDQHIPPVWSNITCLRRIPFPQLPPN